MLDLRHLVRSAGGAASDGWAGYGGCPTTVLRIAGEPGCRRPVQVTGKAFCLTTATEKERKNEETQTALSRFALSLTTRVVIAREAKGSLLSDNGNQERTKE